jgi:hypothetical protein
MQRMSPPVCLASFDFVRLGQLTARLFAVTVCTHFCVALVAIMMNEF